MVVKTRHVVHGILWLVLTFFSTACIFVLLRAEFLAAMQVLVYAGAIIILYVFAVMLINLRTSPEERHFHRQKRVAKIVGWLIFLELAFVMLPKLEILGPRGNLWQEIEKWGGNSEVIGKSLFTDYILPFEVVSLILLVAIVGAVMLAVRRKEEK